MSTQRLVVVAFIALVVAIVVDGLRSSNRKAPAPKSTTPPDTSAGLGVRHCAAGDMTIAIELRRPSHRHLQDSGIFEAHSQQRVATVVVRNVSDRRCRGGSALTFTIRDRTGRPVGEWSDSSWFIDYYQPGGYRTFSLPGVYHCDHPGPFTVVAAVGGYTARRHGLSRSAITCS